MKKDAKQRIYVNIVGEQTEPGGETNRIEMQTEGCYYEADGAKYIEYEERDDDQQEGRTQVVVTDDIVSILREGASTSHMVLKKGQKSFNTYTTPLGALEMAVLPTYMDMEISPKRGSVDLSYQLDVSGLYAGQNTISITYHAI